MIVRDGYKFSNAAVGQVTRVAATMAIEDMFLPSDFLVKMLLVAEGEMTSEEVRQEVIKQYAR